MPEQSSDCNPLTLYLLSKQCKWLQIVFAQVAGPLTWSIVALRNSLVLHSLDKVISIVLPALAYPALATEGIKQQLTACAIRVRCI